MMQGIGKPRSGLTLVEVLVSISIVGILAAILLPVVNQTRESARQTRCANRLRNLSLAAIQYESGHGQYPGYLQSFGSYGDLSLNLPSLAKGILPEPLRDVPANGDVLPSVDLPHHKLGTWAVSLLPYLDAMPTYEVWSMDRYAVLQWSPPDLPRYNPLAIPNLEIYQCPSDSGDDGPFARNSYVANNGYVDPSRGRNPGDFADSMKRANGIFNNKYAGRTLALDLATTPVGPTVRADDIRDGLSNTVIFSENLNAQRWYRVGFNAIETQALLVPALHLNAIAARGYQGMVWQRYDDQGANQVRLPPLAATINGLDKVVSEVLPAKAVSDLFSFDISRPSSEHPDGVNMVFADSTVRFVHETIEYRAYQALLTPHGKASDVPYPEYNPVIHQQW